MKRNEILKLIEENARLSANDIAAAVGLTERAVEDEIKNMEECGIIRGYKAIIDQTVINPDSVCALIELKIVPKEGFGFDEVAERIARYPEVESVSLMSGVCDLLVKVNGRSFQEVSSFVSRELAVIAEVSSTSTQFVMHKYKEFGVELFGDDDDGRGKVSL